MFKKACHIALLQTGVYHVILMNNHNRKPVCSINSFTVYLNILEYSSDLPTAANELEVLHIQRKTGHNWFQKTEIMHSVF